MITNMFSAHNINNNNLSIKNIILLFLTIVLGFASVITLAQLTIPSSIDNAHQTIGRVTITSDGTAHGITFRDFNDAGNGKTYVTGLIDQGNFSGRILGIDENGYLVYAYSTNLIVSGNVGGGGGGGDTHRTGDNAAHIRNLNSGNVGIGNTSPTSGKLHITSSAQTELYLQETNNANAANINFKNNVNTRMMGGFRNRFYIGLEGVAFINITSTGGVGIGTTVPKANLQVIGNLIAGTHSNTIYGNNSSIGGGSENILTGDNSSIYGGSNNKIIGDNSFIGGGGGKEWGNEIHDGNYSSIIGGRKNKIINSDNSIILGGEQNFIERSFYSFAAGFRAKIINTPNTFVRNSDSNPGGFTAQKEGTFLINVPISERKGGVGINTPNPQAALHVSGHILGNSITLVEDNAGLACLPAKKGQIILSGNNFFGCDGSQRKQLDN